MLNDDVLLEIFDFYLDEDIYEPLAPFEIIHWITLAHVCRRWRSVIFQSPHRLNLQLLCTPETPARDTLDIWPPLPLVILDHGEFRDNQSRVDNILAALEHNDRVCKIHLRVERYSGSELECFTNSAAMQRPFPELTHLRLGMYGDGREPILPDSFLGGTALCLRSLAFSHVSFPGLPKLLLSAPHLVHLYLFDIPGSGYIRPEAMATSFSALTSLDSLCLQFRISQIRLDSESRRPPLPPLTRPILPSLTKIEFEGTSDYLEGILAGIDAPRLIDLHITFFNQFIFDTSQLFRFISGIPTLMASEKCHISLYYQVTLRFSSQTCDHDRVLQVTFPYSWTGWRLSSLEQMCSPSFPPVSTSKNLYIFHDLYNPQYWLRDDENPQWLDLLRSFVAVKNLYLSDVIVRHIAPALQELVGGRTTEVLPALENIFLWGFQASGPLHEGIKKFVAARQLVNRAVSVSRWDSE